MRQSVLIVDDSLTVRMDIGDGLDAAGFDAVLCADLQSARSALSQRSCGLIVLDVLLPDGDGLDFLKELRGSPATARIPVLLLSTENEVKNRVRGMHVGADEYVGKPYDLGQVVARARALVSSVPLVDRRVLVIDDSATFRSELKQAIEGAGYQVDEASTGEEGLLIAAAVRPDAVVIDGMLPGIDGATVVRRLKSDAALRSTPCLLLTAAESTEEELRSLEAGADAHVRKSEDLGLILVRIAALLRNSIATRAQSGPSLLGPKRLLAVDDSVTYLQELGAQLRQEGYDVVLAQSGEEALELLAVQPVDCILLDLIMPGLSGHDTCRRIKQRAEWRDIPLVMLTGRDDRHAMIEGINAGADDYIAKSADFDILKARLRAQLRRKHFEDENRRIREKLVRRETEARFQRLIHSNIIGMILGHLDGRVTDANDAFLAMLGYSRAELEAGTLRWNELTPSEWRASTDIAIDQLKRQGSASPYENEYFRKDGSRLPTVVGLVLMEGTDTIAGFVLDRTEQKLAEVKLKKYAAELEGAKVALEQSNLELRQLADARSALAERFRSANVELESAYRQLQATQATLVQSAKMASLGELVAGVAHEINNPLAFAVSHLGTARKSLGELDEEIRVTLSEKGRAHWERAVSRLREMGLGLDRIADLVVKLRTFSRLDEGEQKTVSARECVESVMTILGHRWKGRVQVELRLCEADRLDCFPALLNQALLNLVSNALDALHDNHDNGALTISTALDGESYVIAIADSGKGIPPELRERVFEPFFTTKPVGQGTGLGLSITYSIVRKHGGTLELREREGGGTTAVMRLPRSQQLET